MLFKEIYEMAGVRTSSHSGRRTFATRLNANAVELFDVWGRSIWNELSSPRKKGRSAIGVKRTSLLTANVRF
jgi:hypothetical protein